MLAPAARTAEPETCPDNDLLGLLDSIGALVREAAASVDPPVAAASPTQALRRLATGRGRPGDEALLGIPLDGARVVVIRSGRPSPGDLSCHLAPGEVLHLLRGSPRRARTDPALDQARRLANEALRREPGASAGISGPVQRTALAAAAADARDAAHLRRGVAEAAEEWAAIALQRLRPSVAALTVPPLELLRAYDAKQRTDLETTLAAWLEEHCDTQAAATRLNVHPNTLRYRLRRGAEIAGLDLHSASQRLVLSLLLVRRQGC